MEVFNVEHRQASREKLLPLKSDIHQQDHQRRRIAKPTELIKNSFVFAPG